MQAPTLFIIAADLTKMQVNANIDEADVGRIRPNQTVTFRVDAYPGEEFQGAVSQVRLQPVVVQNVTTYATIINVPNSDLKLKPGMTANLRVQIARRGDVVRIANAALRFRPSNEMFAALNQPVPQELQGGRGGRGRRNANADTATAAPALQASSTSPRPGAGWRKPRRPLPHPQRRVRHAVTAAVALEPADSADAVRVASAAVTAAIVRRACSNASRACRRTSRSSSSNASRDAAATHRCSKKPWRQSRKAKARESRRPRARRRSTRCLRRCRRWSVPAARGCTSTNSSSP